MELETKDFSFELKAASDDGTQFEGHCACFNNIDDSAGPDILAPGCFGEDLGFFLADGLMLWFHDLGTVIGKPTHAEEDQKGLFVKGRISATTAGRDVAVLVKDRVIKKLSVGFKTLDFAWLETAEEVAAYWSEVGYSPSPEDVAKSKFGARLIKRAKLYEFSPVPFGANALAGIEAVTKAAGGSPFAGRDVSAAVVLWVELELRCSALLNGR